MHTILIKVQFNYNILLWSWLVNYTLQIQANSFWLGLTIPGVATARMVNTRYKLFSCFGCGDFGNGIYLYWNGKKFHIGCLTLPKMIKHEAHPHKLKHMIMNVAPIFASFLASICNGCERKVNNRHGCMKCRYYICNSCIMKASVVQHPWDSHSLHLIYEPGMVVDHEHDFNCEHCSEDIDSNFWFYHCHTCDLSFHLRCFEISRCSSYSNVKFGATGVINSELHHHSLQFVLNKRSRRCEKCQRKLFVEPVLKCDGTCESIFCASCISTETDIMTPLVNLIKNL